MPKRDTLFPSLAAHGRRAAQLAVHGGWAWVQRVGAVTRRHPGRLRFAAIGPGTHLAFPQGVIFNERWIQLGAHCLIGERTTLTAGLNPLDPGGDLGPEPILRLSDGVVLGRGSHVIAVAPITIGADCYFGPNVYVTSTNHSYDDPDEPIGKQWPRSAPVEIGAGSWIGTNAVILPGARIGRNAVVAAGAVVRGEVPDRSVVAGAPARVVRRWLPDSGWQPPLRTPAPEPIPEGVTAEQLLALARFEATAAEVGDGRGAAPAGPPGARGAGGQDPAAAS